MDSQLIITLFVLISTIAGLSFYLKTKLNQMADQTRAQLFEQLTLFQKEFNELLSQGRIEQTQTQSRHFDSLFDRMNDFSNRQSLNLEKIRERIDHFQEKFLDNARDGEKQNGERFEKIRETLEKSLDKLHKQNDLKLEEMRKTVDEKLHQTLEKRLGESFKQVSERLEEVHRGLGEMQGLAQGVGDLKKVLSNVKTKGSLGEYQLDNLMTMLLSEEQFERNVKTKKDKDSLVEFAVKIPNKDGDNGIVWLPIDSKFPTTEYENLKDAVDLADKELVKKVREKLARAIKGFAKDIRDKYIDPPNTTDFAIMFLPIEGLYAEVVSNVELFCELQNTYRITVCGPSTFSAFLNSLQMGFKTLAIEKRSSEVWKVLSVTKTEFSKFGVILDKVDKKLQEAQNVLSESKMRTRAIERGLRNVEALPTSETPLLNLGDSFSEK